MSFLRRLLRTSVRRLIPTSLVQIALAAKVYAGGGRFLRRMPRPRASDGSPDRVPPDNPLLSYFEGKREGHGIWKWRHYFAMYHRHLRKFVGKSAHVLEIGIFSGGSLEMWRSYFGDQCAIYGVDIEPACKAYEADGVRVLIGDQADRGFWRRVRGEVPTLDVVIDDGGHQPAQQRISLEEMLPHLRPGGVYICEDIATDTNEFAVYVSRLTLALHQARMVVSDDDDTRRITSPTTAWQSSIASIHTYPFAVVIERNEAPVDELVAPKHGTKWQPFL